MLVKKPLTSRERIMSKSVVAGACFALCWGASAVAAQDVAPVREIAVRWMLSEARIDDSQHVVIDGEVSSRGTSLTRARLSDESATAALSLAATLDSGVSSIDRILRCPSSPPPPGSWRTGRRTCRLAGADVVVQIDDPMVDGDRATVRVGLWRMIEQDDPRSWWVVATKSDVNLARDESGEWFVTGAGMTSIARY